MISLTELNRLQLASSLIRSGLRLSIVRALTDVGTMTLRQWWKDIHGVKPTNGKLPETVLSYIKNTDAAAQIAAFVALYKQLNGGTAPTAEGLLVAWQEFERICGKFDINAGYYALRDIRAHIVTLLQCGLCGAAYIYDLENKYTEKCPFCSPVHDKPRRSRRKKTALSA